MPAGILHSVLGIKLKNELREFKKRNSNDLGVQKTWPVKKNVKTSQFLHLQRQKKNRKKKKEDWRKIPQQSPNMTCFARRKVIHYLLSPLVMGWEVIYLAFSKEFLGWTLGELSECNRSEAPAHLAEKKPLKSSLQEVFSNRLKNPVFSLLFPYSWLCWWGKMNF